MAKRFIASIAPRFPKETYRTFGVDDKIFQIPTGKPTEIGEVEANAIRNYSADLEKDGIAITEID